MSAYLTPIDLVRQASDTAETYLNKSVRIIDEEFGKGYAQVNHELIAGFMRTAAMNSHTVIMNEKLDGLISELLVLYREE